MNMVCFSYITVNTLHQGANKDNDDNNNNYLYCIYATNFIYSIATFSCTVLGERDRVSTDIGSAGTLITV